MDELELSSFRHGGAKMTGFSLINRDMAAAYQRDVITRRLSAGSYPTNKHLPLTVSKQHH